MAVRYKFSTKDNKDIHPVDALRSIMGDVDIAYPKDHVPEVTIDALSLNGLTVSNYSSSIVRMSRRASRFNRDEININFCERGTASFTVGKKSLDVTTGEVIVRDSVVDGSAHATQPANWKTLVIPKVNLAHLMDINSIRSLERLSSDDPAARLLHYYASAIQQDGGLDVTPFQNLVSNHILELTALLLSGDREIAAEAENASIPSVRKHAATNFIRTRLNDPDLSDTDVAQYLNVSPSYVRKLFVADNGLQNFIIAERLSLAHKLLTSDSGKQLKIISVAFQCGFSSLYTFNRQFKRRYGYTPSEARDRD